MYNITFEINIGEFTVCLYDVDEDNVDDINCIRTLINGKELGKYKYTLLRLMHKYADETEYFDSYKTVLESLNDDEICHVSEI